VLTDGVAIGRILWEPTMASVGWGAVVLGNPRDLADWAHALKERFDLWVEIHGSETVLRSASLDELNSASEVRDRAVAYIDRLNGAMALSLHSGPVRLGEVIRFTPDGGLQRTAFLEPVGLVVDCPEFGRTTVTAIAPDGQVIPPSPPQPSEVQRWAVITNSEVWLDDALVYFGRATDWFDIYKTFECLIERFGGGKEAAFLKLNWAPAAEVKRLKRTANWVARHPRRKYDRPSRPMGLEEARELVGKLLRRALAEARGSLQDRSR
jgi:hypothetical protein